MLVTETFIQVFINKLASNVLSTIPKYFLHFKVMLSPVADDAIGKLEVSTCKRQLLII